MGITRFDVQTAATQTRIADALERIAAALEVLADPPRSTRPDLTIGL